ncbi:MAG: OmpH family outer membrane protein [Alloprevotella sp.]|nr:OmpH family outer membrane protein [Alloprevotella sp.]
MRKYILYTILLACATFGTAGAQTKAGYLHYDSLLAAMPEYAQVQDELGKLRQQYEAEAEYNETSFKRQFAEFLQGQKDFPQVILLKRQRDLQNAMERGLAYRAEADSLLRRAEADLYAPLHRKLDAAIRSVGLERGYEYIVNLDAQALPFLHPEVAEDATPYVRLKLGNN